MSKLSKKKTIDIDTSGPDVDVELPEEKKEEVAEQPTEDKTYENERETKLEDGDEYDDVFILYALVITALSATSAMGSFCMFHLIKACILNRKNQANNPNGLP